LFESSERGAELELAYVLGAWLWRTWKATQFTIILGQIGTRELGLENTEQRPIVSDFVGKTKRRVALETS
jgi:hypothetical protein